MAVIRAKGQITIPAAIRETAPLMPGDSFDVSIRPEGILLRPQKLFFANQVWFWMPASQKAESEASDDIRAGRTRTYETTKAFLRRFAK